MSDTPNKTTRRHRQAVADLKRRGFTDPAMRGWTFANDNGKCPQMKHARIYDRLLEMCAPIRFSGENFHKATAQDKLARLKNLMEPPTLSPAADD